MFQSAIQTTHSDSVAKTGKLDTTSPLFALASILAEMIEDNDHETISTPSHETVSMPVQDLGSEIQIPIVDLKVPSKEMRPSQESEQPAEPSTPHQLTINQLTQELAQLVSRNEEYTRIILSLRQENKYLRLEVNTIEEFNRAINLSHNTQ